MNFTRAAEELHVSQPALHTKVAKLALSIGHPLYLRDGRQLHLTEVGLSLADFASHLGGELDRFLIGLGGRGAEPLVLAAGEGSHRYVVSHAVRAMIDRGFRLRLLTTDRDETVDAVTSGRADVGVTVAPPHGRGFESVELATYPQVAVLPTNHPLARRRALRLGDLAGAELILPPPGRPQRQAVERAAQAIGIKLKITAEAEGWAQMLHFVGMGVGICIANGCVQPEERMVTRPIEDLTPVTYEALFRTGDAHEANVNRLLDALQANVP